MAVLTTNVESRWPYAAEAVLWRYLHFARIWRKNSLLNSVNFSPSDRMFEMNFGNPFFGFGVPYLGLLIFGELRPQTAPFRSIVYRYHWFVGRLSYRLCARWRKFRRFGSGSAHVKNLVNFSRQQSQLPTYLWLCHRVRSCRYVAYYWSYGTF